MRVYGLSETTTGSTDEKLITLCNDHLKLKPPLALEEIEVSHRVGPETTDNPRPILVKFVSRRSKARVMVMKKFLKTLTPPGRAGVEDGKNGTEEVGKTGEKNDGKKGANDDKSGEEEDKEENADDEEESKKYNDPYPLKKPVYFQDDLIKARANLYYKARLSKKNNQISETWTHDGKVLIKDRQNRIYEIKTENDLLNREQILVNVR